MKHVTYKGFLQWYFMRGSDHYDNIRTITAMYADHRYRLYTFRIILK